MNFPITDHPFFEKVVHAVCLTFLHSIWQGLLLAILAGAMLTLTRKVRPAVRYNLLSSLLIIFVGASGFTFWSFMGSELVYAGQENQTIAQAAQNTNTVVAFTGNSELLSFKDLIVSSLFRFCSEYSFQIVAIWLAVFCFKSLRAVTGFTYIRKIRRQKVHEPSAGWKHKVGILSKRLGINHAIKMMESEIISVPMVTGFFKPIILLPIGLLTTLSQAQVEAIILHELAHVKRRDYLVNLIQICCENLFFFNPALLWISFLIKEEREHCCDDLAISVMQDKTSFIEALITFQDYSLNGSGLNMAFVKSSNPLLYRIKRIIYNNNKPLNAMEKLFVTASMITVAALSVAYAAQTETEMSVTPREKLAVIHKLHDHHDLIAKEMLVQPDTIPVPVKSPGVKKGTNTYHVNSNEKQYEIVETEGRITSLKIGGQQIPSDKIGSYQAEVDVIVAEIKVAHEHAEADRLKSDEMRNKADEFKIEAEKMRQEAEVIRKQSNQSRAMAEEMRVQADKMRANADVQRQHAEEVRLQADVIRQQAAITRQLAEKQRAEYEKMQEALISDLIKEGIIKDTKKLSYRLSDDELVVNGVKQPAALHLKMKTKYISTGGVEMVYNWQGRTGYTTTRTIHSK